MSIADRWLLPDGVNEILPQQARQVEALRRKLVDLFDCWGYDLVMPPMIEYLESLLTGTGNDLALNTFKVTDQLTGRMMGLRADTTPQVARIDAHSLNRQGPTRLCYVNSVLHTVPANMLTSRSPMQIGAELYGHAGVDSDIEVISLMLEALTQVELGQPLTLDLGHVGIYRALVEQAELQDDDQAELFSLLQKKSLTELDALLETLQLSESQRNAFRLLAQLNGGRDTIERARQALQQEYPSIATALDDLEAIAEAVLTRFPQVSLYFDLGELRGYNYHTGAVFAVYVPTFGQPLAKGGRYDEIGKDFGRARPATGFSGDLKVIAELAVDHADRRGAILAPADGDSTLADKINALRLQGERVMRALPGVDCSAQEQGCDRQLILRDGVWDVAAAE
ncbi:ATP phosphoribosyltransferase regulatory subunit [Motiliproteus coralliicola]|uniref:ATP phosphoribosyltransferase regulatory subunit n=1 Tax=Motiliproteus coralliicola TaxID=2283196 RepID=A0A369WG90_9GAMM|nr:ATP phosphoribosyltransferase regulatory subunit [Motiliproteus coralliicola]RDE19626.1 ATP phosphoribosyltransferase regulatory subunit [Motiliproteus coralliicola]